MKKQDKEKAYVIAPRGIFDLCITDAGLAEFGDRRIDVAWELFETRMRKHGYIQDEQKGGEE